MIKIFVFVFALFSSNLNGQKAGDTAKKKNVSITSTDNSDKYKVNYYGDEIEISKKKIDSLINSAIKAFQTAVNDKDNQKTIKESMSKAESKLAQLVDILVDDNSQKEQIKKDIKSGIQKTMPMIDSVAKKLAKE